MHHRMGIRLVGKRSCSAGGGRQVCVRVADFVHVIFGCVKPTSHKSCFHSPPLLSALRVSTFLHSNFLVFRSAGLIRRDSSVDPSFERSKKAASHSLHPFVRSFARSLACSQLHIPAGGRKSLHRRRLLAGPVLPASKANVSRQDVLNI